MENTIEGSIEDGNQGRILVVAREVMSAALKSRFQKRGWPVTTVGTTTQALEKFRSEEHRVVVCEVRLGSECGLFLMRQLLAIEPSTAIILMTEYPRIPEAVSAMRDGARDYLIKPLDFVEIEKEVEFLLSPPTETNRVWGENNLS